MPADSASPAARRLFSAVLRHPSVDGPSDRELLRRFVADRDEEAFAQLVRRHGAMVLAVGRRVTGHAQDAEDAFQAAFLVLARRARQVARPDQLANWLYGVAYRTALEARSARRRVKERQPVSEALDPPARDDGDDVCPGSRDHADLSRVIDEELARVPEKYRAAVVLCDLEGLSRKEAAGRLGVPEGTLSSRLAHARKVLADRLTRRGVTATTGAVAAVLGRDALAVPRHLIHLTARAAARAAAGGVVPPDLVSSRVASLTDGVMKAMIVNRMRTVLGVGLLGLGTLGLGSAAVVGQNQAPAADPHQPLNLAAAPPAAAARPAPGGRAKPAEKIAAKGIDDDDVPYPAVPTQAVVRLEDGKLIVRQRQRGQVPMTRKFAGPDGEGVTSYQPGPSVRGQEHDAADVSVFDVQGNRVQPKVWKEKLKADQHVLVAFDGRLPHPRELTLFKDDTLIVVFPGDVVESRPAPAFPGAPFATPLFPGQPPSVPPPPGGPSAPAAARPRVAPPGVPAPPSPPVDDIPPLGLPATPDRR